MLSEYKVIRALNLSSLKKVDHFGIEVKLFYKFQNKFHFNVDILELF
jgi:hypothetical protein